MTEGGLPAKKAKQTVLRLLALRDHSEQELRKKLAAKRYEDDLIDQLLIEFRDLGYLNDEVYAGRLVRYLATEKLYGDRRIEGKLREKGIPREHIGRLIDEVRGEFSEARALETLIRKKAAGQPPANDDKGKRRLAQNLMGRGFAPKLIFEMLERTLEEYRE